MRYVILSFLFIFVFTFSCKDNRRKDEVAKVVSEWIGKEIMYTENIGSKELITQNNINIINILINLNLENYKTKIFLISRNVGNCNCCNLECEF